MNNTLTVLSKHFSDVHYIYVPHYFVRFWTGRVMVCGLVMFYMMDTVAWVTFLLQLLY